VLAMTGFRYSGVDETMAFAAGPWRSAVWSNGWAWGTFQQRRAGSGVAVELKVLGGELRLRRLTLTGAGELAWKTSRTIPAGRRIRGVICPC
jgi:hypothetical protein